LSDEDLFAARKRIIESALLDECQGFLIDLRQVESSSLTTPAIHRLARLDYSRCQGPRLAVVTDLDVLFGMSRMFQGLHESRSLTLEVFRQLGPAIAWLEAEREAQEEALS
jgi:hypothetical protein